MNDIMVKSVMLIGLGIYGGLATYIMADDIVTLVKFVKSHIKNNNK